MVLIPLKEKFALFFLLFNAVIMITSTKSTTQLIQNRSIVKIINKRSYGSSNNNEKQNLLRYIFSVVKFKKKECEYAFQNCLLDVNNVKFVNTAYYSEECVPFQKSIYCLDEIIYDGSDCIYKLSEKRMKSHFYRMSKNLEKCAERFPNKRLFVDSNKTTSKWAGVKFHVYILTVCLSFLILFKYIY